MEPTLQNGSSVIVSYLPYLFSKPKIGDIVGFKNYNKIFIKRISKIEENKFFLIGDNQDDSFDSRKFGWIEKKDIIGKILVKY